MKSLRLLWIILTSLSFIQLDAQEPANYTGSWLGRLDAGGIELRIVFNLKEIGDGRYMATLDSPDQGATGIPLGDVSLFEDSIRIEAPSVSGFYLGKFTSAKTIDGVWNQVGRDFDLNLEKQDSAFVQKRPQEPKPPFPYKAEEVSFENTVQHFTLGGTLTIPDGIGPFPAVVLVTGSGNQNRDEELFGHKPFKVIADYLTRHGIAVLRYDDRGVGSSGGNFAGATSRDNMIDARSAVEFIFTRKEIDRSKVGVIGHSEGGLIAFMLASEYDDIAFIVSLAGPGVDGKTILLDQSDHINRLSGVAEPVLEDNRIVMSKVYDLMVTNVSYQDWKKQVLEFINEYYSGKTNADYSEKDIEVIKKNLMGSMPASYYAWMRYFVQSDPSEYFGTIKCPVLALNGEKDSQVLAEKNIRAIREGLLAGGNTHITAMILPGLNHLFQHCENGLPYEYGAIEETFDPETLQIISDWILKQIN
jgi:uncharacterized protein